MSVFLFLTNLPVKMHTQSALCIHKKVLNFTVPASFPYNCKTVGGPGTSTSYNSSAS